MSHYTLLRALRKVAGLAILATLGGLLMYLGPYYSKAAELETRLQQVLAPQCSSLDPEFVQAAVRNLAADLQMPVQQVQIRIHPVSSGTQLEALFQVPVNTAFYRVRLHFKASVRCETNTSLLQLNLPVMKPYSYRGIFEEMARAYAN